MRKLFREQISQSNCLPSRGQLKGNLTSLKREAKALKRKTNLTHCQALDIVARQQGYKNWRNLADHSNNNPISMHGLCSLSFESRSCESKHCLVVTPSVFGIGLKDI
jgi:hypothetical protein